MFILSASLMLPPLSAARYIGPDTRQSIVKLDQVTVDADSMRWLSNLLLNIAKREHDGSPEQLRSTAQLIALAHQLNPAHSEIKGLNISLKKGADFSKIDDKQLDQNVSRTWSIVKFLSAEDAGTQSNKLAACVMDVMMVVDPNHPNLEGHKLNQKRWRNIVPSLKEYQKLDPPKIVKLDPKKAIETPKDPQVNDGSTTTENQVTSEESPPLVKLNWLITNASASAPVMLTYKDDENKERHKLYLSAATINIRPQKLSEGAVLTFHSRPREAAEVLNKSAHHIEKILVNKWGVKPPHAKITINYSNRYSSRNPVDAPAEIAVVLDAALRNDLMRTDLIVCGRIREDGSFYRSSDFWKTLKLLNSQTFENSHRLLIPTESGEDIRQLIALENPEFFVKNEVISIDNLTQASHYSGSSDTGQRALATQHFKDFQRIADGRSIGPLCSNKHVRTKLEEILTLMPNHVSARMLLLQGSRERPTKLDKKHLAYELETMLELLSTIRTTNTPDLDGGYLIRINESLDDQIDAIQRYVDSDYSEAFDKIKTITSDLRILGKARLKTDSGFHERLARNTHRNIKTLCDTLQVDIASMLGNQLPANP